MEHERVNTAVRKQEAVQAEAEDLDAESAEEAGKTKQLIRGMTHMYREMEKELQKTIETKEEKFSQ